MDNPTTWLALAVICGFYLVVTLLEKALKEFILIRQLFSQIDLEPIADGQRRCGSQIDKLAEELYLLRRISEEKTGVSADDVYATDKRRCDEKWAQLREVTARRDSSGETT